MPNYIVRYAYGRKKIATFDYTCVLDLATFLCHATVAVTVTYNRKGIFTNAEYDNDRAFALHYRGDVLDELRAHIAKWDSLGNVDPGMVWNGACYEYLAKLIGNATLER